VTEALANRAQTTLAVGITDTATSIQVASAAGFPSSGNYRIRIGNEYLLVTGGQGTTTWTVTRAVEDAGRFAAAAHAAGDAVKQVITVGGLTQFIEEHTSGGYSDELAQDAVGGILTDSSTIDFTYNDATPSISGVVLPSGIKLDDLGTPDDNTDLNASTGRHGLLPKLDGNPAHYLDGTGAWSTPAGGGGGSNPTPWHLVPITGLSHTGNNTLGVANQAIYRPVLCYASCTVTGIRVSIGTSSGNMDVAIYDESFNRLASSGSTASPGTGLRTISFSGGGVAISPGRYWLAISQNNNTQTYSNMNTPALPGAARNQTSAFPLPNPGAPANESSTAVNMIGVVSGGWP